MQAGQVMAGTGVTAGQEGGAGSEMAGELVLGRKTKNVRTKS